MTTQIHMTQCTHSHKDPSLLLPFGKAEAEKAAYFHESFPGYEKTPLVSLSHLAKELGVAGLYVKDESKRFGLNAFKGLGGSYCIGRYIADKLGMDIEELSYEKITSPEIKEKLGDITFVTATDGNHGRGIAWTAHILGQKAVVYMPKGSAPERLENIRKLGAEASITDMNYDQTVAYAAECEKNMAGFLFRILHGRVMRPFPAGSWKDILPWHWKPLDSWEM